MIRTLALLAIAHGVIVSTAFAQSVNLIEDQLTDVRRGFFELGPFHATPVLRIAGGYDSNALSTPEAQEDITALFGPGIRLGLPMGTSAYLDLYQEVDFVWYRDNVDLRQVFSITRLGGGFGGRRLLMSFEGELRNETSRPTSEFDFPVQTRNNNVGVSATTALGWRQKLRATYRQLRSEIVEATVTEPGVPFRLNNTRHIGSVDLRRTVSSRTEAIVEGFYEDQRFDDFTRDNTSYGMRFGFDFSPGVSSTLASTSDEAGLHGRLLLGFRSVDPVDPSRVDYTGLIGLADVSVTSSGGHRLRGVYERDVIPSVFEENWYFVQNRIGGFFRWQVHDRFSVEPGAILGRNTYPLPRLSASEDGEPALEEIVDEHNTFLLTAEYRLRKSFFFGVTARYLDRESNVTLFAKDRLLLTFNLALRP